MKNFRFFILAIFTFAFFAIVSCDNTSPDNSNSGTSVTGGTSGGTTGGQTSGTTGGQTGGTTGGQTGGTTGGQTGGTTGGQTGGTTGGQTGGTTGGQTGGTTGGQTGGSTNGNLSCKDINSCMNNCANNDKDCIQSCYDQGSQTGKQNFSALMQCVKDKCSSVADDQLTKCAEDNCPTEMDNCFGNGSGGTSGGSTGGSTGGTTGGSTSDDYPQTGATSNQVNDVAYNLVWFSPDGKGGEKQMSLKDFYKKKKLIWLIISTYDCPACQSEEKQIGLINLPKYYNNGFQTIHIINGLLSGPQPSQEPAKIVSHAKSEAQNYGDNVSMQHIVYGYLKDQSIFYKFIKQGYPLNVMIDGNTMQIQKIWEGWDPNGVESQKKFIEFLIN